MKRVKRTKAKKDKFLREHNGLGRKAWAKKKREEKNKRDKQKNL